MITHTHSVQKRTKSVELVEDDFLFTISSDDEFLDAEETDKNMKNINKAISRKQNIVRKRRKKFSKSQIPRISSTLLNIPMIQTKSCSGFGTLST